MLKDEYTYTGFISLMEEELSNSLSNEAVQYDINSFNDAWKSAFDSASSHFLSNANFNDISVKRPWISSRTIHYVSERRQARMNGDSQEELKYNKLIKSSIK